MPSPSPSPALLAGVKLSFKNWNLALCVALAAALLLPWLGKLPDPGGS